MKVGIIGAGFAGLAAAYTLSRAGNKVVIFDANKDIGGLAMGWKEKGWKSSLEKYYHHIFENDSEIIRIAKELGVQVDFYNPVSANFIEGKTMQLDSAWSLLNFSQLKLWSRLHMGIGIALMKLVPNGIFLERWKAVEFLPYLLGEESFNKIWKPLLVGKFAIYADKVNMAWVWARVFKRTKRLGYFKGGFQALANAIGEYVTNHGGALRLGNIVKEIKPFKNKWVVNNEEFDKVLITTPTNIAEKLLNYSIAKSKPSTYLSCQVLVLRLKKSILPSYWISVLERDFPFLVLVEHTKMISKNNYNDEHILYIGNYLTLDDPRLKMNINQLLELFINKLKLVAPSFSLKDIIEKKMFVNNFAQPVFEKNYSEYIPKHDLGRNIYLCNMEQVYPWDRGTNYAVRDGIIIAGKILTNAI